jgi:hypothetical protein
MIRVRPVGSPDSDLSSAALSQQIDFILEIDRLKAVLRRTRRKRDRQVAAAGGITTSQVWRNLEGTWHNT